MTITTQLIRFNIAAAVLLLFGTIVPAYAQHEQESEKQGRQSQRTEPTQQQQRAQQAQPQQRAQQPEPQRPQQQQPQRAQQVQQPRPQQRAQQPEPQRPQQQQPQRIPQAQQPQRTQQQAVAWQQQRGWQQQGAWQGHSTVLQDRAQHWDSDHRTWAQRGGYGGYYIPQASFSLSFGSQHWFRMPSPTIYLGYPRFRYGGYSFLLVDPWPEYWADNWYATDDVYIAYDDYDNGYYLYNRRYPAIRLAITVAL
jgi:hypothetical protein